MNEIYVIEGNPTTWQEAITITATHLMDQGCVKNSFMDGCINREKEFPTGLPSFIPVAIPHTDAIHIIRPAVCIMRLKQPVAFKNMVNTEADIDVSYVLNIAVSQNRDHLAAIQAVVNIFQDKVFLSEMQGCTLEELKMAFLAKWQSVLKMDDIEYKEMD